MTLPALLIVIHETVISAERSTKLHGDPNYLGSYHAIVARNGDIIYLVPPEHKAFAAANSRFLNPLTDEVEEINGSVNDFAYHIALETPIDGRDPKKTAHSGYTREQYNACAWLIKATGVDTTRIVTHGDIKDPPTIEPRCLQKPFLLELYRRRNNSKSLNFGVLDFNNDTTSNS